MNDTPPLPKITSKKKIDIKKFTALAKKVRSYFEEEEKHLSQNANNKTSRFSLGR